VNDREGQKRITVYVNESIDGIKDKLHEATGVKLTYNQTFDFLIKYYLTHSTAPKTTWSTLVGDKK